MTDPGRSDEDDTISEEIIVLQALPDNLNLEQNHYFIHYMISGFQATDGH